MTSDVFIASISNFGIMLLFFTSFCLSSSGRLCGIPYPCQFPKGTILTTLNAELTIRTICGIFSAQSRCDAYCKSLSRLLISMLTQIALQEPHHWPRSCGVEGLNTEGLCIPLPYDQYLKSEYKHWRTNSWWRSNIRDIGD
jgi:hypothetical protein